MKKIQIALVLITLLAFFLRFYRLGQVPPSLEWDEAAIGYDAYSILKTGRDQFGQFLPLTFRSIDDYKPPLYEYLAIPPIAIFGLNEFSVRFPSAVFGTLAIPLTYFLIREVLKNKYIALLSALFLAISPWHLQFSRAAFEVNLSVTLLIGAVLSFLLGFKRPKLFVLSCFLFGLGFFTYHSARVIFPLMFVFLFLNFRKNLPARRFLLTGLAIYAAMFLIFLPMMFSREVQMRFRVTNINNLFTQKAMIDKIQNNLLVDEQSEGSPVYRFFHGQKLILLTTVIDNYFSHFHPSFLFVKADMPLHHAPDFGLLYRFDLPFLVLGLFIYFSKYLNRQNLLLAVWFFLSPLPAAVTLQAPHAVRTELFLPTLQVFIAIGVYSLAVFLLKKNQLFGKVFGILISLLLAYNFLIYMHQYYIHLPKEYAIYWLYGRREAVQITEKIKNDYPKVVIDTRLEMPHLFWLFYTKYDPQKYLAEGGTRSGGWAEQENKFDKYEFRLVTENDRKEEGLYVTLPGDVSPDARHDLKVITDIKGPGGDVLVSIWRSK